jgi:predicted transglutaminase-like cysteine proteinase
MILDAYRRLGGRRAAMILAGLLLATPRAALAETWIVTKIDYPPDVLANLTSVKQDAQITSPQLETSTAPPVRKYREFLDRLAAQNGSRIDQINAVNKYVNANVRQKPDLQLDGDIWAAPLQTLLTGGDCEDVALVKRWGLKRLGFDPKDLFLAMGMTLLTRPPVGHALLAVRLPDGTFKVMYSLVTKVDDTRNLRYFEPAYALNEFGFWRLDEPGRPDRDYWQGAFVRAVQRQEK